MIRDNEIIKMIFGFKVKYLRQRRNLSYQQLAEKSGLSTSYLHDIEKGKKYPKVDKIMTLAKALGTSYDFLVSTKASKKLQPVVDFITSDFIKEFPLDFFGLGADKLFELFSNTPDRVNAFISTLFKVTRNYQMQKEHFFLTALRSYQDMYDNYFPELETAVSTFRAEANIKKLGIATLQLEEILQNKYDIQVDRTTMATKPALKGKRSFFSEQKRTLFLNDQLSSAQENFLLSREIAFQFLELKPRPFVTRIVDLHSFDKLLNNFKASYFAVSLLMEEQHLLEKLKGIFEQDHWSPDALLALLDLYQVTPEMLLQRLSNLLPQHLGLKDLFFIRMSSGRGSGQFQMTKELHLSQIHQPYANESNEKYCRRWLSTTLIQQLAAQENGHKTSYLCDAQISNYWESNNRYLCFTIAKVDQRSPHQIVSVTIGLLVNEDLKKQVHFLNDPQLKTIQVNTTCERCTMPDCESRAAPPKEKINNDQNEQLISALKELNTL